MEHFDVYTMGFSNRAWSETVEILQHFAIGRVIDIRTLPGSRHTPQFNLEHLQRALPESGIEYVHLKTLGGLRKPVRNSTVNAAWRNNGFRGYADYMQTPAFAEALLELIRLMTEVRTVYCCTEAVYWKCHRQLVSDALTIRDYRVGHIFSAGKVELHKLTSFLSVEGIRLTYPSLIAS
jgi:uncharacterized protein (DUF488 family)